MTDVVKIAKQCRAELATEIAKLDEFIRMADKLMKYDRQGGSKAPGADHVLAGEETGPIKAGLHPAAANGGGAQS